MAHLREAATLVGVQVDVVDEQGGLKVGGAPGQGGVVGVVAVVPVAELDVDLDFVILQGNQRQGQTGVAVEPELQGDVQHLLGDGAGAADQLGQAGDVANHVGVAELVTGGLGQLVPDVKPLTIPCIVTNAGRLYLKDHQIPTVI